MSNNIVLTPQVIIATVTATTTSPWIPVDHRYSGVQDRSISGYRTDTNCPIKLLGKTVVPGYDKNGVFSQALTTEVTATVTTWAAAGRSYFSTGILLPLTHIRVLKVNASGAATVVGII